MTKNKIENSGTNIVNIMNFVRARHYEVEKEPKMLSTTADEITLVKKYNIENTFLLQYDVLLDEDYVDLFKNQKDEKMELGLWLEIVRPLVHKVGLEWRGQDCDWDWHIVPGFLMAYTQDERRLLVDEAMRLFKEVFGYYPKTVGSWLIDTYSMEYMSNKYKVKAFGICRDQTSTDAYTLVGGITDNFYFPSKYNMLCPAQTKENQIHTPVFRLLCTCPIHNYEREKYMELTEDAIATMEPVWKMGGTESSVQWYISTAFDNENLGLAYIHTGQENGFLSERIIKPLDMQLKNLTARNDAIFMKMGDTGEMLSSKYELTPTSSIVALNDWTGQDFQSAYYNCKNYVCNVFYRNSKLYIRGLFKFDEMFKEAYYDTPCKSWDAIYENLPVMDTQEWGVDPEDAGIFIDGNCEHFAAEGKDGILTLVSGEKTIVFSEDKIVFKNCTLTIYWGNATPKISVENNAINYLYKTFNYSIKVDGQISQVPNGLKITNKSDIKIYLANGF